MKVENRRILEIFMQVCCSDDEAEKKWGSEADNISAYSIISFTPSGWMRCACHQESKALKNGPGYFLKLLN